MPRASDPSQSFDLSAAHAHSSLHRAAMEASEVCGCFYCLKTFPPSQISEWTDRGETALCPRCGIDAVIGSKSGYPLTREFLKAMNSFWF